MSPSLRRPSTMRIAYGPNFSRRMQVGTVTILHMLCSPEGRLKAVPDVDFLEDMVNVGLDRVRAEAVRCRYNRIAVPLGQAIENVQLLWCQRVGISFLLDIFFETAIQQ